MKRPSLDPKHGAAALLVTAVIVFVLYELLAPGGERSAEGDRTSRSAETGAVADVPSGGYRLERTSWTDDGSEARAKAAADRAAHAERSEADPRVQKLAERLQGIDIAIGRAKR